MDRASLRVRDLAMRRARDYRELAILHSDTFQLLEPADVDEMRRRRELALIVGINVMPPASARASGLVLKNGVSLSDFGSRN